MKAKDKAREEMNLKNGRKPTYLFVGAFAESTQDGGMGGQLYACRTLVGSPLSEHVNWVLLDTTMKAVPRPPVRRRLGSAIARVLKFMATLCSRRIDGVLIFTSAGLSFVEKGLMVWLARLAGKRVVLAPRSGLLIEDYESGRFMRWYIPFILRRCTVVLCQSTSWKRFYQSVSGLPADRFEVIRNWMDPAPYLALGGPRAQRDSRKPDLTVLFLGWIERYKGIFELIEAVKSRQEELGRVQVLVCGRGSETEAVKKRIAELGLEDRVILKGWVSGEEKLRELKKADIFVLPSRREGMPNALLEAMAASCAVVATDVGGVPEVIGDESVGRLVASGDVHALGAAIVDLVKDTEERERVASNGRQWVVNEHSITAVWPRVHQVMMGDSWSTTPVEDVALSEV